MEILSVDFEKQNNIPTMTINIIGTEEEYNLLVNELIKNELIEFVNENNKSKLSNNK